MMKNLFKVATLSLFLFAILFTQNSDLRSVQTAEAYTIYACYGLPMYGNPPQPTFYPAGSPTMCSFASSPTVTLNTFSPSTINVGQSATISFTSGNANWCNWGGTVLSGQVTSPLNGTTGYLASPITVTTPVMNTPGTYTAVLNCYNDVNDGPPSRTESETRTLTVVAAPPPAEPTFSASCALQSSGRFNITLGWGGVAGAVNYPVRLTGPSHATNPGVTISGGNDIMGMGAAGDSAPTASGFAWTGLTAPGSYSHWGHAWNSNGWSGSTARSVVCTVPSPTITSATAGSCGTGQIVVSWSSVTGAASYTLTDTTSGQSVTQVGTTFTHTGLAAGSSHTYVVRANIAGGSSANSAGLTRVAPSACATPVTGVCGSAATSYASGATTYSGSLCSAGTASPASPAFPAQGGSSSWTCLGQNGGSNSPLCTATRAAVTPPPPAPTGLSAVAGSCGTGQINLSWSGVGNGTTGYQVYRSGVLIGSPTSPVFTDSGRTPGTTYTYTVRSVAPQGNSGDSSSASAVGPAVCATTPSAPTLNVPTAGACSTRQINLSWTDSTGETNYVVQAWNGTTWIDASAYLAANVTSHTWTAPADGTSYTLRIFAGNGSGWTPSNSRTISSPAVCAATPVNGVCGPAATSYASGATTYSGALCNPGTASPASPAFPAQGGSSSWTCLGANGGSNAACSASRAAAAVVDLYADNTGPALNSSWNTTQSIMFTGNVTNNSANAIAQGGWADLEIDYNRDGSVNLNGNAFGGVQLGSFIAWQVKSLSYTAAAGTLPAGNHRYRFHADTTGTLAESNDGNPSNNQSAWVDFVVVTPAGPNLVSENLAVTGVFQNGSTLTLNANVRNAGGTAAGAFSDNFTYQWNGTGGTWQSIATIAKSSGLAVGATSADGPRSFPLTQTGTLYIQHCVDSLNQINEGAAEIPNCSVSAGYNITNPASPTCTGRTTSNCTLPGGVTNGGTGGSCATGYSGSCNFTCNTGSDTWTQNSNTCSTPIIPVFEICRWNGTAVSGCGASITTTPSEAIAIRWSSSNADNCARQSGPADFSTGGATSGTDSTITASAVPATTLTYTIVCSKDGSALTAVTRSVTATTNGAAPTLSVSGSTVSSGSSVTVSWDANNGNEGLCTLTGGGLTSATLTNGTGDAETGSANVTITGRTTFTLTCAGQSAVRTVEIIPVGWES